MIQYRKNIINNTNNNMSHIKSEASMIMTETSGHHDISREDDDDSIPSLCQCGSSNSESESDTKTEKRIANKRQMDTGVKIAKKRKSTQIEAISKVARNEVDIVVGFPADQPVRYSGHCMGTKIFANGVTIDDCCDI